MLIREGRIVAVAQEAVTVRIERASACGTCRAAKVCAGAQPVIDLELPAPAHAYHPGQTVRVGLAEGPALRATATVYLVPVAGLLGGLLTGQTLALVEPAVALLSFAGLGLGLIAARRLARQPANRLEPHLIDPTDFSLTDCKEQA